MALDMAAPALQGRRWLEDMPQRLGASLAVGREVIQCGDELMAFVWETVGLVALRNRLHVRLLPALSLVGIQNLNTERRPYQKNNSAGKEAFLRMSRASQNVTWHFDTRSSR